MAGRYQGMRVLAKEEDMARALVRSLDAGQLERAVVAEAAYPDVLTKADSRARLENQPAGLPASDMTAGQVDRLMALIGEYANNLPADVAERRLQKAKTNPSRASSFLPGPVRSSREPVTTTGCRPPPS